MRIKLNWFLLSMLAQVAVRVQMRNPHPQICGSVHQHGYRHRG